MLLFSTVDGNDKESLYVTEEVKNKWEEDIFRKAVRTTLPA
jgi:hypothetical protein